jgi:hypothetical protein
VSLVRCAVAKNDEARRRGGPRLEFSWPPLGENPVLLYYCWGCGCGC